MGRFLGIAGMGHEIVFDVVWDCVCERQMLCDDRFTFLAHIAVASFKIGVAILARNNVVEDFRPRIAEPNLEFV